ncbi:MAG: antitoxin family protein [Phycisphaerae bacterium]
MVRTIDAIYENGVFRPVQPAEGFKEHERVCIAVLPAESGDVHPMLKHCGALSHEDAQAMLKVIQDEFEKVDPNEWK